MPYKNRLLLLKLLLVFNISFGQQFGGSSPAVKWMQVNSPSSRIIFPKGLDSTALRVSNVISWLDQKTQSTIGNKRRKINVILQNQTTISNAYVSLAPFRSEFLLTPDQNSFELGSLPWADQLAIHEFRHVQQYNNFDVGISKVLSILFGEDGQALANGAAIPNWFFEGEAVYNETNVSNQGRGRLPFFFNPYRSLWSAGKHYSWLKLRNGSYRDFIPDHYALGYLLVAYGKEKYGDGFWKQVTHDAAAFKGPFYPFQTAIKKYSGVEYVKFRNDAFEFFRQYFKEQVPVKSNKREPYINEEFPVRISEQELLYVKSGFKIRPSFVIKTATGNRKVRARDIALNNQFSYRNGTIVYATYRPDIRWRYKDYSDLRIINISTGIEKELTNHTKYFSPDINEKGNLVVAVNVKPVGNCALDLISVPDGKVLSTIPNQDNLFFTFPKFYSDNEIISAVRNKFGQMSLAMINVTTGNTNYLTPFSYNVIGSPSVSHDTIYYSRSSQNNDRLFAYIVSTKQNYQLTAATTSANIGNYFPSGYFGKITWSSFTAEGFKIHEKSLAGIEWKVVNDLENSDLPAFGINALTHTNANELAKVPAELFPITRYHKATGLFNFHSIQPNINDPEYTLNILGENVLNTFQSDLSLTYNRSEQWKRIGLSTVYGALFPYLSAEVKYTIDRRGRYHGKTIYWNELEPGAGISMQLDLSKNRSISNLNLGSTFTYNQTNYQGAYKDSLGSISNSYLNNFLVFTNQIQKTRQQIFPTLAQSLSLNYKHAVTHYSAAQFSATGNLYLPGIFTNHSIVLTGAFLNKDTLGQLNFSSGFPFSRGYSSVNLHQMYEWGVTYHMPFVYPDAGVASILYFLRIRGDFFYDHTRVYDFYSNGAKFRARFRSVGSEIYFDTRWWNQVPLTFGIRYSRLLDSDLFGGTGKNRWELILPVNIFNQ